MTTTPSVAEAEAVLAEARAADEARQREEAQAERRRQSEAFAMRTPCKCCGAAPGQTSYIGTTEREQLEGHRSGIVTTLCYGCRYAVGVEWSRRAGIELVDGRTRAELASDYLDGLS